MFSTVIRVLTEVGVGIFTKAVARENWQPPCCKLPRVAASDCTLSAVRNSTLWQGFVVITGNIKSSSPMAQKLL